LNENEETQGLVVQNIETVFNLRFFKFNYVFSKKKLMFWLISKWQQMKVIQNISYSYLKMENERMNRNYNIFCIPKLIYPLFKNLQWPWLFGVFIFSEFNLYMLDPFHSNSCIQDRPE